MNHLAVDCMLRKREEKKERVKDEAYYVERIEEVRERTKGMSLVAKISGDGDGTYQIWSSRSDEEEVRNPTHGTMYARYEDESLDEEKLNGKCFVSTGVQNSPMTSKVHTLLEYFDIPFSSYDAILFDFDNNLSYINDMLISVSSDAEKSKSLLLESHKRLESKRCRIDNLELQFKNVTCDKDNLRLDHFTLLKQRNIYYNSVKRFYAKLTALHRSSDISKEQHMKLFPF